MQTICKQESVNIKLATITKDWYVNYQTRLNAPDKPALFHNTGNNRGSDYCGISAKKKRHPCGRTDRNCGNPQRSFTYQLAVFACANIDPMQAVINPFIGVIK